LVYLALATPRGFHRRDTLLALFWPELDQERARNALRQAIHVLREALPAGTVINRGDGEVGLDWAVFTCDVTEFEGALGRGDHLRTMELYRGDLLAGFHISGTSEFERWLSAQRRRFQERALEAAWALANSEEQKGNDSGAVIWARRAAELDADDETTAQRLISLLDRIGDRSGAVHAYDVFAKRLAEEYELEPAPETQRIIAAVRGRVEMNGPIEVAWDRAEQGAPRTDEDGSSKRSTPLIHGAARGRTRTGRAALVAISFGAAAILTWLVIAIVVDGPTLDNYDERRAKTVAVLPFTLLSEDADSRAFGAGVAEDLVARLAQVRDLRVISRAAVDRYYVEGMPLAEFAEQLRVGSVVRVSLRREGARVRVVAQLVDVLTEETVWSDSYDRELDDFFAVQSDIAHSVVTALSANLLPAERLRIVRQPPNLEVWTYVETARQNANLSNHPAHRWRLDHADTLVQRALEIDSTFAPAWAVKAAVHFNRAGRTGGSTELDSAGWAVRTALSLDPDHYLVQLALGILRSNANDGAGALAAFLRAVELNPNYWPAIYCVLGEYEGLGRLDQAMLWFERRILIDPNWAMHYYWRGQYYWKLGDYEKSELWLKRALELAPDDLAVLGRLAELYLTLGRLEEARVELGKASVLGDRILLAGYIELFAQDYYRAMDYFEIALQTDPPEVSSASSGISAKTALGYIHWKLGDRETASNYLAESLEVNRTELGGGGWCGHAAYDNARISAIQGEIEEANQWLRVAIDEWHWPFVYIHLGPNDPMLENLRGDPTFEAMMAEVRATVDSQRDRLERIQMPPSDEMFQEMIAEGWADVERLRRQLQR
jgi:TolB-like protein/DNA-binding SARP family transcriptional activator/Tfp pilus assembly protein PilF